MNHQMNSCSIGHIEIHWKDGAKSSTHKCPLCRAVEIIEKVVTEHFMEDVRDEAHEVAQELRSEVSL